MNFIKTDIDGVIIIEPNIFQDDRGYFLESFNKQKFEEQIHNTSFVQDNESKSKRGVLRGLHFQSPPYAQAKLVRCIQGAVLDIAVDIRKGSPTFGKHIKVELTGENKKQLFIPKGFAHGFVVLSEEAVFAYKVDNRYAPKYDDGLQWDDETLAIDWQIEKELVSLSDKDKVLKVFKGFESPFNYK